MNVVNTHLDLTKKKFMQNLYTFCKLKSRNEAEKRQIFLLIYIVLYKNENYIC